MIAQRFANTYRLSVLQSRYESSQAPNKRHGDARDDPRRDLQQEALQPREAVTFDDDAREVVHDGGSGLLAHEHEGTTGTKH